MTVDLDFDCNSVAASAAAIAATAIFKPFQNLNFNTTATDVNATTTADTSLTTVHAQGVTLFFSTFLPLLPLVLNSKTNWNRDKTEAVISHLIGQSATFGTTEFIRHFAIVPDPTFFQKCNLTVDDCLAKSAQIFSLGKLCPFATLSSNTAAAATTTSANTNNTAFLQNQHLESLYASLHSLPNPTMAIVGSSFVIFMANLFLWTRHNKNGKDSSSAHALVKMTMVVVFLMFVSFSLLYRYKQREQSLTDIVISFFYGMVVQFLMTLLFQVKQREMLMQPPPQPPPPPPLMLAPQNYKPPFFSMAVPTLKTPTVIKQEQKKQIKLLKPPTSSTLSL